MGKGDSFNSIPEHCEHFEVGLLRCTKILLGVKLTIQSMWLLDVKRYLMLPLVILCKIMNDLSSWLDVEWNFEVSIRRLWAGRGHRLRGVRTHYCSQRS